MVKIDDNISCAIFSAQLRLKIINISKLQVCWWPIVGKPPVPIPNTVVKTYRGDNTWGATPWEDSTLPRSILEKKEISWMTGFFFLYGCLGLFAVHNLYTPFMFFLRKTALRQVVHRDEFCLCFTLAKIRKPSFLSGKCDI